MLAAMRSPCQASIATSRAIRAGVEAAAPAKACSPKHHAMTRKEASCPQRQLAPSIGALLAAQSSISRQKASG